MELLTALEDSDSDADIWRANDCNVANVNKKPCLSDNLAERERDVGLYYYEYLG